MNAESTQRLIGALLGTTLPSEQRDGLIADIGAFVFRRVMQRAWSVLEYADQNTLLSLLEESNATQGDEDKSNAVFAFLTSKIPELQQYTKDEAKHFFELYEKMTEEFRA